MSLLPSSDQVQSPVVPLVAAFTVMLNSPIGKIVSIKAIVNKTDNIFFTAIPPEKVVLHFITLNR